MSFTSEFLQNPITFLRKYALSPPDGTAGDIVKSWTVANAGNIKSGFNGTSHSTVKLKAAGVAKVFSSLKKHSLFPECMTVSVSPVRASTDDFPQYWLPWDSLSIVRNKLPPIPASIVGGQEDLELFPRFFMTAGINGCSVFVDGPATEPTVYHAGIVGNLHKPAETFWKEQLAKAFEGTAKEGHEPAGQVHSNQYMPQDSAVILRYLDWAKTQTSQTFPIEVQSCFGSVVGIRFGRSWSFYLQENVMIQDIQMVKRSQLDSRVTPTGDKFYSMKGTGEMVERRVTVQHRSILRDKVHKVYARKINTRCKCVRVSEIYPTRTFTGELRDFAIRTT